MNIARHTNENQHMQSAKRISEILVEETASTFNQLTLKIVPLTTRESAGLNSSNNSNITMVPACANMRGQRRRCRVAIPAAVEGF